jgi:hypothetical protein
VEQVSGEVATLSVKRIAGNRVTEILEVDTDLVGASGARHAGDERPTIASGKEFIVGDGIASGRWSAGRHFLALDRVASDRQIDGSLRVPGAATDNGQIGLLHLTVGELG